MARSIGTTASSARIATWWIERCVVAPLGRAGRPVASDAPPAAAGSLVGSDPTPAGAAPAVVSAARSVIGGILTEIGISATRDPPRRARPWPHANRDPPLRRL